MLRLAAEYEEHFVKAKGSADGASPRWRPPDGDVIKINTWMGALILVGGVVDGDL